MDAAFATAAHFALAGAGTDLGARHTVLAALTVLAEQLNLADVQFIARSAGDAQRTAETALAAFEEVIKARLSTAPFSKS